MDIYEVVKTLATGRVVEPWIPCHVCENVGILDGRPCPRCLRYTAINSISSIGSQS